MIFLFLAVVSCGVVNNVRHEMLKKNDLDRDPVIDVVKKSGTEEYKFIDVSTFPFRCVLMADMQLKTAVDYAKHHKVLQRLHLDATGSILAKLQVGNPEMLLYFLVMPMKTSSANATHLRFNIAEFISETQTSYAIERFLRHVYNEIKRISPTFQVIHEIVTDWSWAEINAVISAFNNLSVKQYIELTFLVMTFNDATKLEGIVVLLQCSSHLTKSMLSDIKKCFNNKNSQKEVAAIMGQIFDCETWKEVENCVLDAITILSSPKVDSSVKNSINRLAKELIDPIQDETNYVEFEKEEFKQIFADSPFYQVCVNDLCHMVVFVLSWFVLLC